jgi:hypothetical protein
VIRCFHVVAQETKEKDVSQMTTNHCSLWSFFYVIRAVVILFLLLPIVTVTLCELCLETLSSLSRSKDKHGTVVYKNLELIW